MTQYLAKVQGMLTEVEAKLKQQIHTFLWGDKKFLSINKETIYAPIEMGGCNLLDIVARNVAITITWLKSYLCFGPDRLLWAFAAEELQALNILGTYRDKVDKQLRLNIFLQSWSSK